MLPAAPPYTARLSSWGGPSGRPRVGSIYESKILLRGSIFCGSDGLALRLTRMPCCCRLTLLEGQHLGHSFGEGHSDQRLDSLLVLPARRNRSRLDSPRIVHLAMGPTDHIDERIALAPASRPGDLPHG